VTRRTISLLILIFTVVTIIFVIPLILRRLNAAPLTLSSQPDLVATPEKAIAPSSNPWDAIKLLAVTEKETGVGLQARPVDTATLIDLPDYAAMDFGHHYTYAVSPNRKILAVITWPRDSSLGGVLHLIDLNTWTDTPANLNFDDYVNELTFGGDNRTLYWTISTANDPAHGMPRDYQLYRYDLDSRQLSAMTRLPSSFIPWS
jgi:hypothetical protein